MRGDGRHVPPVFLGDKSLGRMNAARALEGRDDRSNKLLMSHATILSVLASEKRNKYSDQIISSQSCGYRLFVGWLRAILCSGNLEGRHGEQQTSCAVCASEHG